MLAFDRLPAGFEPEASGENSAGLGQPASSASFLLSGAIVTTQSPIQPWRVER